MARDLSVANPVTFRIAGPAGANVYPSTTAFVDRLFGASGTFGYLKTFRNDLRFDAVDLPVRADASPYEVLHDGDLRVTSIAVDHGDAPAVAFRVEHAGRAVVVSGDLASKDDNLARLATGADLLIYDATVLDPPGSPAQLYDLHTSPRRIGEVAALARVRSLLLSHITPSVDERRRAVLDSIRAAYSGEVRFAEDCETLDVARRARIPLPASFARFHTEHTEHPERRLEAHQRHRPARQRDVPGDPRQRRRHSSHRRPRDEVLA